MAPARSPPPKTRASEWLLCGYHTLTEPSRNVAVTRDPSVAIEDASVAAPRRTCATSGTAETRQRRAEPSAPSASSRRPSREMAVEAMRVSEPLKAPSFLAALHRQTLSVRPVTTASSPSSGLNTRIPGERERNDPRLVDGRATALTITRPRAKETPNNL